MDFWTVRAPRHFSPVDHRAHFEKFLETHNFIVVQAISLKIGTPDISGLLFLNLQSELS